MKLKDIIFTVVLFAACLMAAKIVYDNYHTAVDRTANASFDTQLKEASKAIDKLATEGREHDAASFDTQLNKAKAAIDAAASAALAASASQEVSASFDTQLNEARRKLDEIAREGRKTK